MLRTQTPIRTRISLTGDLPACNDNQGDHLARMQFLPEKAAYSFELRDTSKISAKSPTMQKCKSPHRGQWNYGSLDVKNDIMKMKKLRDLIIYQRYSRKATEKEMRKKEIASAAPSCAKRGILSSEREQTMMQQEDFSKVVTKRASCIEKRRKYDNNNVNCISTAMPPL